MNGKRVVVIGGGQRDGVTIGNGRAIAVLFAREGAEVVVVDRDLERARATVAQIAQEGGRAHALAADVSNPEDCERAIQRAMKILDRIDVLVNNVGINENDSDGGSLPTEAWDTIMATNLRGAWLTSRAAVGLMRKSGGGAIVNISSVAALNMGPNFAYGVSKSAVNALTERMAAEFAPFNIRVNAVMPGSVTTPMYDSQLPASGQARDAFLQDRARMVPLRRLGTAWDIANAVLFLASEKGGYITGVLLPVDGGFHVMHAGGVGTPK